MSSSRTLGRQFEAGATSPPEVLTSKYHAITPSNLPDIVWVERKGKWWPGKILGDRSKVPLKIQKFSHRKGEIVRLGAPNKNNIQPFHCLQADEFIKQWKGCEAEKEFKVALSLARDATLNGDELPSMVDILNTAIPRSTKGSSKAGTKGNLATLLPELSTLDEDDLPTMDSALRLSSKSCQKSQENDDFVSPPKPNRVERSQRTRILKGNQEIRKIEGLVRMPSLSELTDIEPSRKEKTNVAQWRNIYGPTSITRYSKPLPAETQTKSSKKKLRETSSKSRDSKPRSYLTDEDDDDDFASFSLKKSEAKSKANASSTRSSSKPHNKENDGIKGRLLKSLEKGSTKIDNKKEKKKKLHGRDGTTTEDRSPTAGCKQGGLHTNRSSIRKPTRDDRDELSLRPSRTGNPEASHSKRRTPAFSDSDSEAEKTVIKPRTIIKPRVIRHKKPSDEAFLADNSSTNSSAEAKTKKSTDASPKSYNPHTYDSGLGSDISQQSPICELSFESQAILNEDPDFDLDTSIMIPGELCLAYLKSNRSYFPGKIISYKRPNKYKAQLYDGQRKTLSRNEFFTIYEPEFQTCPLGDFTLEKEDPEYENPSLRRQVMSYEDDLIRIMCGDDKNSWRYDKFFRSLRERRTLAHYISRGPFGINDFHFISRVVKQMFLEQYDIEGDLMSSEGLDFMEVKVKHLAIHPDLSNPKILQLFCDDVLHPEVIIRLIMAREKSDYGEAEQAMLHGYIDSRWVEQVMAARHSFVDGRISLGEKHGFFVDEDD
ncbi:hypothetical protein K493DRAFT_39414 [Basidiobolus meristosporus CBS 931.73]|uniref:PWWP domain-containing protein n=1 Tax=Basidiobolus meristosporus CBS 931.73 TaxID=1314790 RepID=A0A1Y1Y4N6_9FUNG|nr:hypothetical protein K493DRAFT_39414 [Basidiobolus meristosporus CBS 931.73]|eukprot:ORX92970.1 hypothetical protein K493DRAFT_39414 [Basidiobolus meristosporus CBS 931.73]